MEKPKLSGIERELVLQYLIDGNVPVTLTPISSSDANEEIKKSVHSLSSAVFPVAIKGEKVKVKKNGKILLENPPQSVLSFAGKNVKVEFYFNRIGLFFNSLVTENKKGLELKIPENLSYIEDVESSQKYDFIANLYYECQTQSDLNVTCVPWKGSPLFTRPVWKTIPLENQQQAKKYLELFVEQAKLEKNAGNGIQLIPICNYLTSKEERKIESIQDRLKPPCILYVDHERIVLGSEMKNFNLISGAEYALKMSFTLNEGPIDSRDLFVTCRVNKIYNDVAGLKYCADCCYTKMQEEDMRFLYEKATSKLFY